jgi:hypothetical protein
MTPKDPNAPAVIVLRTTLAKKGEYVRRAREEKKKLNEWCLGVLDESTKPVPDKSVGS